MAENQCCVQKDKLLVSPLSTSVKGYRIKERFGIRSLKSSNIYASHEQTCHTYLQSQIQTCNL